MLDVLSIQFFKVNLDDASSSRVIRLDIIFILDLQPAALVNFLKQRIVKCQFCRDTIKYAFLGWVVP